MKAARYYLLSVAVSFSLIMAHPAMFSSGVHARSKWGGSSSYRSGWSKSGSYSKPSRSVWGKRSGGGIFGTSKREISATGYSKPSGKRSVSGRSATTGYSKPGSRSTAQTGRFSGGSSFDGKLRETARKKQAGSALKTYTSRQAGSEKRRPSNGYSKPGREQATQFGGRKASSRRGLSSGYSKPGDRSARGKERFSGSGSFDRKMSEAAGKDRAKRSLSSYRKEQTTSRERTDYRASQPGAGGGGSVDDVIRQMRRALSTQKSRKPPTARGETAASRKKFSEGYSRWSSRPKPRDGKFAGGSAFDGRSLENSRKERSKRSLAAYKAEQEKFKKGKTDRFRPEAYSDNRVYQKVGADRGFSYKDHYDHRDRYWRDRGYRYPSRMFGGRSSFGLWDAAFLYGLLHYANRPNAAAFAYHHQNDPGYRQWRLQANEQAKQDPEMRKQLAELDKQVASMGAQGVQVNPAYLPEGVPPEIAVSAAALAAKSKKKPVLRLATGQQGGIYYEFGKLMKKAVEDLDVEVMVTAGSVENIDLLEAGKADAALVQSDVLAKMPQKRTEQGRALQRGNPVDRQPKVRYQERKGYRREKARHLCGPQGIRNRGHMGRTVRTGQGVPGNSHQECRL